MQEQKFEKRIFKKSPLQYPNRAQWDTARQIGLIFVRDILKSVGCVIIRFLRYYRLTDDNYKPSDKRVWYRSDAIP